MSALFHSEYFEDAGRLQGEAEVVFEEAESPFAGMKLVGFSIWRSVEGEMFVTFPSRSSGIGSERRYFDYLRSVEGGAAEGKRVKAWILEQFRAAREMASRPLFT